MHLSLAALFLLLVAGGANGDGSAGVFVQDSARKPAPTDPRGKIDSQLLQAIDRKAGKTRNLPEESPHVDVDAKGLALVDVRADVTAALHSLIRKLGGTVASSDEKQRSTIARVPLDRLETLAGNPAVRFIGPAAEAMTQKKKKEGV